MTYAKWLRQQLDHLNWLASHPAPFPHHFDDLADLIAEAEQRAASAGLPAAVEACQIRPGPVGIELARRVLSKCLGACAIPKPESKPDTLNPPMVARQLKVSPDTVRGWCESGLLKASNVATGKRARWIIQRSDLDTFLQSRQRPLPQPARRRRRDDGFRKYRD